ncbi:MAG: V-type ATP synthase subunit I [Eubacteriales bacterium]
MAIAKMERLSLVAPLSERKRIIRLLQSFQRVELCGSEELEGHGQSGGDEVADWTYSLQLIGRARTILEGHKKSDALQKLKKGRQVLSLTQLDEAMRTEEWRETAENAASLDEELQECRKRRRDCVRLSEEWSVWRELNVMPSTLSSLKRTTAAIGAVPSELIDALTGQLDTLADGQSVYEIIFRGEKKSGLLVIGQSSVWRQVRDILAAHDFTELQYSFAKLPRDMLTEWNECERAAVEQEARLLEQLKALSAGIELLDTAEEYFQNLILRDKARGLLQSSKTCFLLSGWIRSDDRTALEGHLEKRLSVPYYMTFSEPVAEEVSEVPTALKNGKIVSVFETLTETYSMPAYDEIDPTPFMTPFYLVFFGMMVADVGYGLLLLIATFLARTLLKPDRGLKQSMDFFFYLSFPSIAWGLVYGSMFGIEMPFVLLSQTGNMIEILVLSVALGFIQIIVGLCVSCYLNLRKKNVLDSISSGFAWIGLLFGLAFLLLDGVLLKTGWLLNTGAALSVVSALSVVVVNILQSKHSPAKGLAKGLYALYGVTGYIGDLVSYSRLMALGVAGGSIAVAFNTIINILPLPARLTFGVVLALALHALNMFLTLLGAYVHGIRLQYVEFFGKFYSGGGRKFSPFKPAEKYVYIAENIEKDIK